MLLKAQGKLEEAKNRVSGKRGVNPSVASMAKRSAPAAQNSINVNLLQPPKKRKKGRISVNTELANNPKLISTKAEQSNSNTSSTKALPPSARFAKEMWGRKT